MKKQIALLFAIMLSYSAIAQNDDKENKLHLGFIATSSFGYVNTESKNIDGGGLKAGLGFGIYGDFFFAKNYAFNIEVLHSTQGYKVKADSILSYNTGLNQYKRTGGVTINYQMRSFQIPVTLKLRTNEIGYWRYYGQIGVAPSFTYKAIRADYSPNAFAKEDENSDRLVNDEDNDFIYNDDNLVNPDSRKDSYLEEDNVSGIRVPILIGAGAEWNISGSTSLVVGVRYEYGLLNMMKAEHTIGRRNVFSIVGGIRF